MQDFLDCVIDDSITNSSDEDGKAELGSGHTTPTAARTPQHVDPSNTQPLPRLSSTNLARTTVHDVAVDVVITPLSRVSGRTVLNSDRNVSYKNAMQAACIISIWSIEGSQYYTLTFTSAVIAEPVPSTRTSSRVVNRSNTGAYLRKSRSSASSSSSGHHSGSHSGSHSNPASKVVTPILQQPEFPPRGPPQRSRNDISTSASIFQKATQLKDAILNSINMPAYGLCFTFEP